jgi:hypothetical protein
MSSLRCSNKVLRTLTLLFALTATATFSAAQHDKTPKPSAPAPKASAPAPKASAPHPSAPAAQRPSTTTARPGATPVAKPGTATGTAARPGTANAMKPEANGKPGMGKPGMTAPGKPATTATGRPGPVNKAAAGRIPPGKTVSLKGGGTASVRPNGQIRSIDRNGMHIQRGLSGQRRIESTRNGARVVTVGRQGGYVQRAYVTRNGTAYVSRTYVVNNVAYTNVYRSYSYGGYCCYYGYAPAYYYRPVYYGWAYNPWPAPVYYNWGWGGAPWYGYYGPYYAPYPVYPSAAFWLTDYMIAASLQASYEAQMNAGRLDPTASDFLVASLSPPVPAASSSATALSPEVKQLIADEVKAQLAADQDAAGKKGASGGQQAASGEVPPALDPKRRTFVVSSELSVAADGEECSLTAGDVISRVSDTPDDDKNLTVKVLASKKADCAVGKEVAVSVDDLQEMHNKFREQLTGGMGELAKKQGTSGLPKAPDTSTSDGEVPAPQPDTTAAKALQEQQGNADQVESQTKQEAAASGSEQ